MLNNPVKPHPAATLIMLRKTSNQPLQTLMVKRHTDIKFAGGAIVFPGGRVDTRDHSLAERHKADAFKIAAIRETFEESGILLACDAKTGTTVPKTMANRMLMQYRPAICNGNLAFGEMLDKEGLIADTNKLLPFAHWITPPNSAKRFDTHFFVTRYGEDQKATHDGAEITETIWISPAELLLATSAGHHKLVFATRMNVERLAVFNTVDQALKKIRTMPVVTVRPETVDTDEGKRVRIPLEAGYGGELFVSNDPSAI